MFVSVYFHTAKKDANQTHIKGKARQAKQTRAPGKRRQMESENTKKQTNICTPEIMRNFPL